MSTISKLIFNGAEHNMTSPYGPRNSISTSKGNTSSFHNGTDYGTKNKKIAQYAIEDGYIFAAQKASDGALYVWVIYPRIKKAFLHYHLDSYVVKAGQKVKKGTKLGYTGKTGKATGIHLHLGIRDLSKLTTAQINSMNWTNLQKCSYIDPEKLSYTAPKTSTKPVEKTSTPTFTKFSAKVTALSLHVRNGAGTQHKHLKYVYKGNIVTVIGESGDWYKITHGGTTGYCSKKYLTKVATTKYYPKYSGNSNNLDTILKAIGAPAAYYGKWSKRKPIAKVNGISNYVGSEKQNSTLITLAKQGKLIKP